MSFKNTVLFAPHMAPLVAIAGIAGIDFHTFKASEDSTGLATRDQLQQAIGLTSAIPLMEIKKAEHLNEVTTAGAKLIDAMKRSKLHDRALVSQLIKHLVDAGNKATNNYHVKQNGAGDKPAVSTGTHAQ